jgi:hypothetical protein
MNSISISGPNLKVTSETTLSKNSSHNFRTPFDDDDDKIGKKNAKITRVNTVSHRSFVAEIRCKKDSTSGQSHDYR